MTLAKPRTAIAALLLGLGLPLTSQAGPILELIDNGEFESFSSESNWYGSGWIKADTVPGWSSSEGHIEIWKEGAMSSPTLGSDGLATGFHVELTGDSQNSIISTTFIVPESVAPGTSGTLSFDFWARSGSSLAFELNPLLPQDNPGAIDDDFVCQPVDDDFSECPNLGSEEDLANLILPFTGTRMEIDTDEARNQWLRFSRAFDLEPGEAYELSFLGLDGGTSGSHIDQVSFAIGSASLDAVAEVPAPAPLALIAAGLVGLRLRRIQA